MKLIWGGFGPRDKEGRNDVKHDRYKDLAGPGLTHQDPGGLWH